MDVVLDPLVAAESETETTIPIVLKTNFTLGDAMAAHSGDRPLYFYGYVAYATSLNRVHEYYWRYQNDGTTGL